ncbi:MAG: substrate-binding domain-containing protein [Methylobacteriaceae bacterium]|nr:substrate-binding domain-containing protein [Methylobacteriaceae bacterium]
MRFAVPLGLCAAVAVLTASAFADEGVKIGYINKMGEHPWFVAEVGGAKSKASQLGVTLMTQDVQFNADLTLTTFDTMVGDGVKAIAIVVPDKALGPVVAEKAAKAGIKLIAVDDDIYTSDKKMVPYIGMNAEAIGRQVGAEEARLYKSLGWDKFNDVRIGSIEDQKADTCMRRNRGAEAAFFEAVPNFDKKNIIHIPYDNPMESAIENVTTTLTANPDVKHWIFYSCNDDGVLGGVRATENQGIPSENVIGVGIDGSRSCGLFGEGKPTGFRGSMYIDSAKEGATAVELLYNSIKDSKPLPETTYVTADLITLDTFPKFRDKLCKK